jgi:hypothetical protein
MGQLVPLSLGGQQRVAAGARAGGGDRRARDGVPLQPGPHGRLREARGEAHGLREPQRAPRAGHRQGADAGGHRRRERDGAAGRGAAQQRRLAVAGARPVVGLYTLNLVYPRELESAWFPTLK